MARRVLEAELLATAGITQKPLGPAKSVEIVKEVKIHKTSNGIFSLRFNFSGEMLAIGLGTGGIQIYDTKLERMEKELRPCRQGGFAIQALRFHPKDPQILYAATAEGHIHVYNIKTGLEIENITEPGNEINSMDFSVDGYNFVTGGKDLGIRLYETRSNKLIREWPGMSGQSLTNDRTKMGNTMRVFSLRFHSHNQYIFVSGGWDNHLKIWDVRDSDGVKRNIRGPHICGDALDVKDTEILSGQWTALHALQEFNYSSGQVSREINFPHTDGAFLYAATYCNNDLVFAGGSGTCSAEVIEIATNRHVGGYKFPASVHTLDTAVQGRLLAAGGAAPVITLLSILD